MAVGTGDKHVRKWCLALLTRFFPWPWEGELTYSFKPGLHTGGSQAEGSLQACESVSQWCPSLQEFGNYATKIQISEFLKLKISDNTRPSFMQNYQLLKPTHPYSLWQKVYFPVHLSPHHSLFCYMWPPSLIYHAYRVSLPFEFLLKWL